MSDCISVETDDLRVETLHCRGCAEWLALSVTAQKILIGGLEVDGYLPLLACSRCGNRSLPYPTKVALRRRFEEARDKGEKQVTLRLNVRELSSRRFKFCQEVAFKYDSLDYYFIPGLYRPSDDGFLTPVFFSKDVMVQYYNHPDYAVTFHSESYGTVYIKNRSPVSFGINRAGRIVIWLGDIDALSREHQLYLASKNLESDHDIGSEFYTGQIEAEFTEPSREKLLIANLQETSAKFFAKYGVRLLQLDEEALPLFSSLEGPIHFTEKEMSDSIEVLCKLLVERIYTAELKKSIRQTIDVREFKKLEALGGLKTLELWLARVAMVDSAEVSRLMSPMFVLYDLRVAFKHLVRDMRKRETIAKCLARLQLSGDVSNEQIYDTLLNSLRDSYAAMRYL